MTRLGGGGIAAGALVVVVALLATGCSNEDEKEVATFDPPQGPVDVDTPELRVAKAAAGIEDCPAGASEASAAAHALPDIVVPCLGGGSEVNLAGLAQSADKPLVLNFWAQYCGPCKQEAPLFEALHKVTGERADVIGVDFQDPQPGKAIALAEQLGLTYPQLADPGGATRGALGLVGLPATVFVAQSGEITHIELREVKSLEELADLVEEHLDLRVATGGAP